MVIFDDNIELSAVLEEPEGSGPFPLVIILHGFTSAKDRPHTLLAAQAMRDAGYATLRFDLYGHGESGGTFREHTLFKWISNTIAVIDWAREKGYTELYLSGHSQGGLVAALVGSMEADRISGLILRAPAFLIPEGARSGCLLGYHFDPENVPEEAPVIKGMMLGGNYIRVAQTIHVEDAMDRFHGLVLILHGDQDDLVPLEDSRVAARRYRQCELAAIAGETHHFDRYPEQMQQIIRTWLEARSTKKG